MAAIKHDSLGEIVAQLENYIDVSAGYLIGQEVAPKGVHLDTSGQHLHFAVQMDEKQYDAFRKTVLVKQFKLRGQAKAGLPRQYGRIKDVRSDTKFLAYTVKDGNILYKNIDPEIIKTAIEQSYKKEDKKDFQTILMEHLLQPHNQNQILKIFSENQGSSTQIHIVERLILKYHMDNVEKPLCLSRLRYYTNLYLQKYCLDRTSDHLDIVLDYLKNRN